MASGDALFRREIEDAQQREAEYRRRLSRHRTLALKLRAHAALLREALREANAEGRADAFLFEVARVSSQALEIPRASVWLFDASRRFLVRRMQLPADGVDDQPRIDVAECPGYLRALNAASSGAVAVNDAWNDPRTSELGAYLQKNDVTALLDVPLVGPGELRGVLCHEHQRTTRVWQEEEIDFATDVGMLVLLALEVERRTSAERQQRGTEARYQHLVESLPCVVYSFDARSGQLDYLSPRIARLAGRNAEDYLVAGGIERWVEAIDPEDRGPVSKRLSSKLADEIDEEIVYRVRLPDGTRRYVRDTCSIVRDVAGAPVAVQGTLADVTAQRESELGRVQAEAQHRALLAAVDLPAVMLDSRGRVEFINDCFLKLSGYAKDEVIGADAFELLLSAGERARVRNDFLQAMAAGEVLPRFETLVRARGGSERRILWTNSLLRGPAGDVLGCSSLGVDMTERLEAEAQALQNDKLESLGRLAASVAHDFNNLLMVISGATDLLRIKQGAAAEASLSDIQAAATQAAALTKSLLAYARREPIRQQLVRPDLVVEGTLGMLGSLMRDGVELAPRLNAPTAEVMIDQAQLRQVLMNLVGNAVDATAGHGTLIRLTTDVVTLEADEARAHGLTAEGSFWVLTVSDDGRGIASEHVGSLFDPFFTTKGAGEGTGLGLAISSSVVRRAGGFIAITSALGQGAQFRVHLPTRSS